MVMSDTSCMIDGLPLLYWRYNLEYIDKHFDEIEYELNGEEYKEPKHNRNLCIDCNVVKTTKGKDYERSTLVCIKCGLCKYYRV